MLSLFCVLKGLKLGLVRGKPWLEASSQAWGELGLLMHVPHSRYSSAWQKKRRWKQRCRGVWLQVPSCSPYPWPVPVPVWQQGVSILLQPPGHPCCSRAGLFLCCRGGAVTSVKPGMCLCAFQHKPSSQLITENICSFSLNPSTASVHLLARADVDGSRGHVGGSSALPGLLPHPPLLGPGVSNTLSPWPWTGLGFGSCFPQLCPPNSWAEGPHPARG